MSVLMSLAHEAAHVAAAVPAADGGLLDWVSAKNTQAQTLARALAVTLGIGFVILAAVASRGSMSRIIVAGLAAGLFIWVVMNVTAVKDRVGNEIESAPAPAATAPGPPPTLA